MIREGTNEIGGVCVEVARKCCRRINVRVAANGDVHMTIPKRWSTLREGEEFLLSKWDWVLKARERVLARQSSLPPVSDVEIGTFRVLLAELNAKWSLIVGESGVTWKIRRLKSVWGCCHWRERYVTYNAELARVPRELVEYVVAHEYSHFAVRNHGPEFRRLMDERLPGWQSLRKRLNSRAW